MALMQASADVNIGNNDSEDPWTPLHIAAHGGHEAIVRELIERGADITTEIEYDGRAMGMAASKGHAAVVLAIGEAFNKQLYLAVQSGDEMAMYALVAAGADVNKAWTNVETLLRIAA